MISLTYFSFLNAFKYRDRTTIIRDILEGIRSKKEGMRKTQVMNVARLNYIQTKKYLNYLLNYGFLAATERETYVITEKGKRFLQLIEMQRIHTMR